MGRVKEYRPIVQKFLAEFSKDDENTQLIFDQSPAIAI